MMVFWRSAAAGGGVCTSSCVVLWLVKKHRRPYCQRCVLHTPFLVLGGHLTVASATCVIFGQIHWPGAGGLQFVTLENLFLKSIFL